MNQRMKKLLTVALSATMVGGVAAPAFADTGVVDVNTAGLGLDGLTDTQLTNVGLFLKYWDTNKAALEAEPATYDETEYKALHDTGLPTVAAEMLLTNAKAELAKIDAAAMATMTELAESESASVGKTNSEKVLAAKKAIEAYEKAITDAKAKAVKEFKKADKKGEYGIKEDAQKYVAAQAAAKSAAVEVKEFTYKDAEGKDATYPTADAGVKSADVVGTLINPIVNNAKSSIFAAPTNGAAVDIMLDAVKKIDALTNDDFNTAIQKAVEKAVKEKADENARIKAVKDAVIAASNSIANLYPEVTADQTTGKLTFALDPEAVKAYNDRAEQVMNNLKNFYGNPNPMGAYTEYARKQIEAAIIKDNMKNAELNQAKAEAVKVINSVDLSADKFLPGKLKDAKDAVEAAKKAVAVAADKDAVTEAINTLNTALAKIYIPTLKAEAVYKNAVAVNDLAKNIEGIPAAGAFVQSVANNKLAEAKAAYDKAAGEIAKFVAANKYDEATALLNTSTSEYIAAVKALKAQYTLTADKAAFDTAKANAIATVTGSVASEYPAVDADTFKKAQDAALLAIASATNVEGVQAALNAFAAAVTEADGWHQTADGTWYYIKDAKKVTGWNFINSYWYYMDANGNMKTGWLLDNGTWYYLANSGAMATGWYKVGGTWYYSNNSGAMQTGWVKVGGTWYLLDSNGAWVK